MTGSRAVLSRRARGRALQPAVASRVATALGGDARDVSFSDLAAHDRIMEAVRSRGYLDAEAQLLMTEAEARSCLDRARARLPATVFLLHDQSDLTGAAQLPRDAAFNHALAIAQLDGEDFFVTSEDGAVGVMLEHIRDWTKDGQPLFRIRQW